MRSRFAPAVLVLALVAIPARAFERNELLPGDTAVGDILLSGTFDEFPMACARGSYLTLTIGKSGAGGYQPSFGLYNDEYASVPVIGVGPTSVRSESTLASGRYRILVAARTGSVGALQASDQASHMRD